jgi:predicted DNA-binding transcriptional regulator YafY
MARKRDQDATASMKALMLYSLLLFSGRRYSLSELARRLECSKATIMRLVEHIEVARSLHVRVETDVVNRQRYYWAATPAQKPNVALGAHEIQELVLCRDLLWNLLPAGLRNEVGTTIDRTTVLLDDFEARDSALNSVAMQAFKGSVDYSDHEEILKTLIEALHSRRIVALVYRAHDQPSGKAMAVAPLRLVSHRDALYLLARREQDLQKKDGFYEPRLAVQRIESASLTERSFPPLKAAAEDAGYFGFMPGTPFQVVVEAKAPVAPYIRERTWSRDQRLTNRKDGRLTLKFSATSESEVVSWVLGFAGQVKLIAPEVLRKQIADRGAAIGEAHESKRIP